MNTYTYCNMFIMIDYTKNEKKLYYGVYCNRFFKVILKFNNEKMKKWCNYLLGLAICTWMIVCIYFTDFFIFIHKKN